MVQAGRFDSKNKRVDAIRLRPSRLELGSERFCMNTLELSETWRAAKSSIDHVVVVLTPYERDLFLPGWKPGQEGSARVSHVDVSQSSRQGWLDMLREMSPTVLVTAWSCPTLPLEWWGESSLRYLCSITGSVKPRVPRAFLERGLLVSNWGSLISHTVAEHALLLILASLRGIQGWPAMMREPRDMLQMMRHLKTRRLRGARVGIHGFGAIARELVLMLKPHHVELSAYSEGVPQAHYDEYSVRRCRSLEELFAGADILIECEGLNERTKGAVTREMLALLADDAVFVNVGRGRVVDECALIDCAREGRLRVALDVYHREPLPEDSPLLDTPGILLSPHVAGPTSDTYPLCGEQALENVARFLRGETPSHLVTLEAYDRST